MTKYLHIKAIRRVTLEGEIEEIKFNRGVNVITGKHNAGKTTWLKMLDYILGKNEAIKNVFSDTDVSEKYFEYIALLEINGKEVKISRRPMEHNIGSKISIDDVIYDVSDFSKEIYRLLEFPLSVKFPKGNPYTTDWVDLSFRIIYRHIYRRENFWGDIADKQPINEQYAAQFQLFGIANKIYSRSFDTNVKKEKELLSLEIEKKQYEEILSRMLFEMAPKGSEDPMLQANDFEIGLRISELESELSNLEHSRNEILNKNKLEIDLNKNEIVKEEELKFINNLATYNLELEKIVADHSKLKERLKNFKDLFDSISDELSKLKRTKKSGIISDIKITVCPACDQKINSKPDDKSDHCFLCDQLIVNKSLAYNDRIDFEISQLESEKNEIEEVVINLNKDLFDYDYKSKSLREKIFFIEKQLKPLKQAMFNLSNEDISEIDVNRGRIIEQIQNYLRLTENLKYKDELNDKIKKLEQIITTTQVEKDTETDQIDFPTIADDLAIRMQNYVNEISRRNKEIWTHKGRISIAINQDRVSFYVDNKPWNSLGGQDREIFLLSYHYGLLAMTGAKDYQYPGLVIIDLPAELGKIESHSYNYIASPFIRLTTALKESPLQIIIAGRIFEGLTNSTTIHLETVWKTISN